MLQYRLVRHLLRLQFSSLEHYIFFELSTEMIHNTFPQDKVLFTFARRAVVILTININRRRHRNSENDKIDDRDYIVWFGLSLGESYTYESKTKEWK